MSAFAKMKNSRKDTIAKLTDAVNNTDQKASYEDDRYWRPVLDKAGEGNATIRFMPAPDGEDIPFVVLYEHAFNRVGGWYIEKSRTTLGKDEKDPVSELNSDLWAQGDSGKRLVSGDFNSNPRITASKRKKYFIANILVVKHEAKPEDEGKTFLFKFGQKIMDKIKVAQTGDVDAGDDPIPVFDFWEGANFLLKIRKVAGQTNYDTSKFAKPSELLGGDEDELEAIYNGLDSLKAEIAPDKFKSYDDLKKRLVKVLGGVSQATQTSRGDTDNSDDDDGDAEVSTERQRQNTKSSQQKTTRYNDDDDDDAFIRSLKEDDDNIPY